MLRYILPAILLITTAHAASALTVDDKSMNGSDGSARYSDPDDNTPMSTFSAPAGANHYSREGGSRNGSTDPSGIRYDYDAASGTYVPTHQ